jgi:Methyltransferase domain
VAISDLLKFGGKRPNQATGASSEALAARGSDAVVVSKALPKFIAALSSTDAPILIDFGPVIGPNVAFFGETLGCKLFIEDLGADLDRHTRAGTREALPDTFAKRFQQADDSVDGVLCWDIFDFLERPAAQALAREVVRVLKPGGVAMGFFCSSMVGVPPQSPFTKFEIVEETSLRQRSHSGASGPKFVLQNRDIIRMFEGLSVADSFLLKSNTREMLLRKRA